MRDKVYYAKFYRDMVERKLVQSAIGATALDEWGREIAAQAMVEYALAIGLIGPQKGLL